VLIEQGPIQICANNNRHPMISNSGAVRRSV
jgi:hypothetical protein